MKVIPRKKINKFAPTSVSIKASKCKRCMKNWGDAWNKYDKALIVLVYKEQLKLFKKYTLKLEKV